MNTKHDYLVALIRQLEKENNQVHLPTFWAKVEGELKMRKKLQGYIDLPISEEQYDTLISTAEFLLGADTVTKLFDYENSKEYKEFHKWYRSIVAKGTTYNADEEGLGRTEPTTGGQSASIDDETVNHILKNYTPDQLTIDIINKAAQDGDIVDGRKITKKIAANIEKSIREKQKELDNSLSLKEAAAALDIDYADIANQDLDNLKTLDEVKKIYNVSDEVMEHFKETYKSMAAYDEGYHSGAIYTQADIEKNMAEAPEGYKMIWYYPPFEQYFVGDIKDMNNFPFIYKDSDPSHEWVVKNTPVVGPFASVKELADYYDVIIHEHAGMDIEFMDYLVDLVTMIKHYESKNDKGQHTLIIDTLWSKMKTFLLGNI